MVLTTNGQVRYEPKTPYCNGTTHAATLAHPRSRGISASLHVIFEPLDFIAKLAALVPKPRVNLTRIHGVFVGVPNHPNSKQRVQVTPAKRGKQHNKPEGLDTDWCDKSPQSAIVP